MNTYVPVPFTGWLAVVTTPKAEFLVPVRAIQTAPLIAVAVVALLIVLLSLWLANSIAKPVCTVAEKMDAVAGGDLGPSN